MDRYEIIIYWSDDDGMYVAEVPELPGCSAHGESYESALSNAKDAIASGLKPQKSLAIPFPSQKAVGSLMLNVVTVCLKIQRRFS